MKVSELITELQKYENDFGDMTIIVKHRKNHHIRPFINYVEFEPWHEAAVLELEKCMN